MTDLRCARTLQARAARIGFSTVELVVVVIVIAILLAVTLPILKKRHDENVRREAISSTEALFKLLHQDDVAMQDVVELLDAGAEVNAIREVRFPDSTMTVLEGGIYEISSNRPWLNWFYLRFSVLAVAIRKGRTDIVQLLLERGANLNGVDDYRGVFDELHGMAEGVHPIFWAAHNGDEEMFDLLWEAGVDLEVKVNDRTIFEWAEHRGRSREDNWLRIKRAEMEADEAN